MLTLHVPYPWLDDTCRPELHRPRSVGEASAEYLHPALVGRGWHRGPAGPVVVRWGSEGRRRVSRSQGEGDWWCW